MSKQCTLPHILLLFVIVYQIQGSNVPNLSIGANGDIYYCLLYNDSSDSTITWDYSNKFFNRYDEPESEYFYCYINSTENMCSRHKDDQGVFVSSYWDGPPVLNHLWQEFTPHKLYPFEKRSYNINLSNGFQRSFSLKMKDVDILLCNKKNIVSDCVTILLNTYTSKVVQYGCMNGENGTLLEPVSKNCSPSIDNNVEHKFPIINTIEWHHFSIKLDNNIYSLLKYGRKEPIIQYIDNDNRSVEAKYITFKTTTVEGNFKIHKDNALAYNKSSIAKITITAPKYCVLIFVKTCKNCTVEIVVYNTNMTVIFETLVKQAESWQQISLNMENANDKDVLITASVLHKDYTINEKWYISNTILRCYKNDLQPLFTNTDGCCYALKYPEYRMCTKNLEVYNSVDSKCPDNTIGKNCISCEALFDDYCPLSPICDLTPTGMQCSCPAGYQGTYCSERCPDQFFGFDCRQKCGKCLYSCDHIHGFCYDAECESKFIGPFCNITVKSLTGFPPIPTVVSRNSTTAMILVNMPELINKTRPAYVRLEIKDVEYSKQWRKVDVADMNSKNHTFTVRNLSPNKRYELRTVFAAANGSLYPDIDSKNIPTTFLQKFCRNLTLSDVQVRLTDNTLSIQVRDNRFFFNACRLDRYNYVVKYKDVILQSGVLKEVIVVNGVQPHTCYTLIIMLQEDVVLSTDCPTDTEVCGPIHNLRRTLTDRSMSFSWQKPLAPKCDVENYIVQYKLTQYLGCKVSAKIESTQKSITTESERVTLEKLHPYSLYEINIYAVSKHPGQPFLIEERTNASNITAGDIPEFEIYNTPKSLQVIVQRDCRKQTGPTRYHLDLICESSWCSNQKYDSFKTADNGDQDIYIFNVVPYTEYNIATRIERPNFPSYTYLTRVRTASAVPGPVLDLTFHSANSTSVGLRWLPPYPPMSPIDSYELVVHHGNSSFTRNCSANQRNKCTLWEGYCYTFNDLLKNTDYTFTVSAVNTKRDTKGESAKIGVFTIDVPRMPSPPLNITLTREEEILTVHWLHPAQPHGHISKFHIRLNEEEEEVYCVNNSSPTYEYSIDVSNFTAKQIRVVVTADNDFGETPAYAFTHIPPKAPTFASYLKLERLTNSCVRLTLPEVVDQEGLTCMYVILTDINQPIAANNDANFKEYFEKIGINGAHSGFITVVESTGNKFPETIEYNNSRIRIPVFGQYSDLPEGTLQPGHSYRVTIVLNNTYSELSNYRLYFLDFTLDVSMNFLAFLVIPVVLGAVLCAVLTRKFFFKSKSRNSLLSEEVQSDVSEVLNDEHIYESASEVFSSSLDQNLNRSAAESSGNKLLERFAFDTLSLIQKRYTKTVNIRDLDQYVKDSIDNGDLVKQFQKISDSPTKPANCGNAPENVLKNMIPDLAAYDHTRVKLESIYENPFSDYINANFINGYAEQNNYIATQGPKSNTINDFWLMIWQQRVEYIIAVSGVFEGATRKFEKYWPEINGFSTFGEIHVLFTKVEVFANYKIRHFTVTYEEKSRNIKQIQFCCPIDVGAPQYIRSFVSFSKKVLSLNVGKSPIVVHGRDGFGRTGILILCDICLRMALAEAKIDIFHQLYKMRQQRVNMIENVDQYQMVHFILLLILQCVSVPSHNGILCNNTTMNFEVENIIATRVEKQLKFLDDSAWQDEAMKCINLDCKRPNINAKRKLKHQTEYADDFSNASFLPYPFDNPDQIYIRADVVDSFLIPSRFITTRNPTNSNLGIFWKLIIEKKIKIIISLNKLNPTDTNACMFYPSSNALFINPLPNIKVKFASKQSNTYCDIYHVNIIQDDNPYQPTPLIVIQLREWHQSILHPEKPNGLIACYESMNDLGKLSSTILVTCHDGIRACGLYVAFCYLVDKIQADHNCDVCLAVQTVRQSRREFVRPTEQFQFLYRCGLEFVKQFDNYANFDSKANIN